MTIQQLVYKAKHQGTSLEITLEAVGEPLDPELKAVLKQYKDGVIAFLVKGCETVPRLPWQLERLVSAASSNCLNLTLRGIPDLNRYVMAWGCAYLISDQDEALKRLWQVYEQWQDKDIN